MRLYAIRAFAFIACAFVTLGPLAISSAQAQVTIISWNSQQTFAGDRLPAGVSLSLKNNTKGVPYPWVDLSREYGRAMDAAEAECERLYPPPQWKCEDLTADDFPTSADGKPKFGFTGFGTDKRRDKRAEMSTVFDLTPEFCKCTELTPAGGELEWLPNLDTDSLSLIRETEGGL